MEPFEQLEAVGGTGNADERGWGVQALGMDHSLVEI